MESKGTPSAQLQQALANNPAMSGEDDGSNYEMITEASPEAGVFTIVGGYLDEEGEVHSEVQLRSLTGREEEMLGNDSISINQRLNSIMTSCTQRIGSITDKGQIAKAINSLPAGARTHLLICLKRTSHFRRIKDRYEMEIECPHCGKEGSYAADLSELETYDIPDPSVRTYEVNLLDAKSTVVWQIAGTHADEVMAIVMKDSEEDAKVLSYQIAMRVISIDGTPVKLNISDFLSQDHKKLKLSKNALQVLDWTRKLTTADREDLRESFMDNEPGVELNIDVDCRHCKREFTAGLDVAQKSFFFPTAVSRRSKRRRSI